METRHSKRARILSEVLHYVDGNDWESMDGFLVFGRRAFLVYTGEIEREEDSCDPENDYSTKVLRNRGERAIARRATLRPMPSNDEKRHTEDLLATMVPDEARDCLQQYFLDHPEAFEHDLNDASLQEEAVDSYLAWKAIDELESKIARVSKLDPIDVDREIVSSPEYFEEAHRCDEVGLHIASAVMCRAVLEEALKQVIDHAGLIKASLSPTASYTKRMIHAASARGALSLDRRNAALDIHEAGNKAIHELAEFKIKHEFKARTNVDKLRMVVEDLYKWQESSRNPENL